MKFTPQSIRALALPPGKIDCVVFDDDCPGLGLRIRQSGVRTWVFQYQIGKRTPRLSLGRLGALTLTQARKQWGNLHARVRLGEDPAASKAPRRQLAAETVGATVASLSGAEASTTAAEFSALNRRFVASLQAAVCVASDRHQSPPNCQPTDGD
jgi:hypothetical protein